ncbi:hypothetical protein WMY93_021306 [Mugilogobius chulae]|uniref:Uncharacterized protein n=1 Tax=Mugilogobius chulae TaxID=88201 RepID=A0AAW0NG45_9GOBI
MCPGSANQSATLGDVVSLKVVSRSEMSHYLVKRPFPLSQSQYNVQMSDCLEQVNAVSVVNSHNKQIPLKAMFLLLYHRAVNLCIQNKTSRALTSECPTEFIKCSSARSPTCNTRTNMRPREA